MRALSVQELLNAWEQGLGQPPAQRALILLAAACSEDSPEMLAACSIGERDTRLLTLREWTFGSQMVGLATCLSCGQRLELNFSVGDLRCPVGAELTETFSLSGDGYRFCFRLPNSLDLAAAADCEDVAAGRQLLLERCILASEADGDQIAIDRLSSEVIDAIVERMAQADPQGDVQLALTCPQCDYQWQAGFDIASFFWKEINAWANRILMEVHTLASAYGWRESDILNMTQWRRQAYLHLVSG